MRTIQLPKQKGKCIVNFRILHFIDVSFGFLTHAAVTVLFFINAWVALTVTH